MQYMAPHMTLPAQGHAGMAYYDPSCQGYVSPVPYYAGQQYAGQACQSTTPPYIGAYSVGVQASYSPPPSPDATQASAGKQMAQYEQYMSSMFPTYCKKFIGDVVIETRANAMIAGTQACLPGGPGLVYFTDGSALQANNKGGRAPPEDRWKLRLGAAVVRRSFTQEGAWDIKSFAVPFTVDSPSLHAELTAIGHALQLAESDVAAVTSQGRACDRVTVYTDCQAALNLISSTQTDPHKLEYHRNDVPVRRIAEGSIALQLAGVEVELRWVPGHAGVEGNEEADRASRAMSTMPAADSFEHQRLAMMHLTSGQVEELLCKNLEAKSGFPKRSLGARRRTV